MATGGTARSSVRMQDPGATLREGYMSSLRARTGRTSRTTTLDRHARTGTTNTETRDVDVAPRPDRIAEFRARRHDAQQRLTPGASTPQLQAIANDLRNDGDEEDAIAASELEESMNDIGEESAQADDLSQMSKTQSALRQQQENAQQSLMNKGQKELERIISNLKTEGPAKMASAGDQGELLEVADTIGTGTSVVHIVLSFFQDRFDDRTKDALAKIGFPMLDMSKFLDTCVVAITPMQVFKWSFMVTVLAPFCIIFVYMGVITACKTNPICKAGTGFLSSLSSFLGS